VIAVALVALSTAALAAVGADDGRVPSLGIAPAGSAAPAERIDALKRDTARERESALAARPSDELRWPLRGAVTGQFGEPRGGRTHDGLDIPMPAGTPIRAAGTGRVVMRETQDGYGKYTCVAHRRFSTCYGHQSSFRVRAGARVRQGEVIGRVGNTGNSGTTHLHFEVRRGTRPWGTPVNPLKLLPRGR
jgi:murein DD-endopeptidase MepM/ murein hydrolase activator NlpD